MQGGVAFEFQNVWYTKASLIAELNIESFHDESFCSTTLTFQIVCIIKFYYKNSDLTQNTFQISTLNLKGKTF